MTGPLMTRSSLSTQPSEVARVVDQNIDSATLGDSGSYRRLCILWTGDVQPYCERFVISDCSRDLRRSTGARRYTANSSTEEVQAGVRRPNVMAQFSEDRAGARYYQHGL